MQQQGGGITDRVVKKAGENESILQCDQYDTSVAATNQISDSLSCYQLREMP